MQKKKIRENLFIFVKIIFSLLALIYVLSQVSVKDITNMLSSAVVPYLFFALLIFTVSKILSAVRAFLILNQYSIPISGWGNLKLYWTGMFYNLFLPGGIGGDIYKTVVINKIHRDGLMISTGAVLMDRIAGVTALIVLAILCMPLTDLHKHSLIISLTGVPLIIIGFIVLVIYFLPQLRIIIGRLLGLSFLVQISQMLSVFFIMKAVDIRSDYVEYQFIFLVSSVAAMLPLSVGGIGIRELVFFSISNTLLLDQKAAVTISFAFYLTTVLVSSLGVIPVLEKSRSKKMKTGNLVA